MPETIKPTESVTFVRASIEDVASFIVSVEHEVTEEFDQVWETVHLFEEKNRALGMPCLRYILPLFRQIESLQADEVLHYSETYQAWPQPDNKHANRVLIELNPRLNYAMQPPNPYIPPETVGKI